MSANAATSASVSHRRSIAAGLVGNVMEWYDFGVYGYYAPILGRLFFPADDPTASLLAAFGVFGAGFLVRPLGGIVFGHLGDRVGRVRTLRWSMAAMVLPTAAIGLLPTAAAAGTLAPLLLVFFRLVQGLAVGGEYTASIVFLAEAAPAGRRGLSAAWAGVGCTGGTLLGSGIGALVSALLTAPEVAAWGWRLPFLFGLLLGGAGILLRRLLVAEAPPAPRGVPLLLALRTRPLAMLQLVGLALPLLIDFYLLFIYAVSWLRLEVHVPLDEALDINTLSLVVLLVSLPAAAWLSDRVGRRPLMLGAALGFMLLAWPLFSLMQLGHPWAVQAGQVGLALLLGCYAGPCPAAMAELFPRPMRCAALGAAFNITAAVFGGTTPLVAAALVARTGYGLAPAFYAMLAPAVALATLLTVRESAFRPLDAVPQPA